jgi:signal transduction histidine kinase
MKCLSIIYRLLPFLLCAGANGFALPEGSSAAMNLEGRWQYHWGAFPRDAFGKHAWCMGRAPDTAWKFIGRPELIDDRPSETDVWTRTILPELHAHDPSVVIFYVKDYLEVYLDDSLVYRFGDFSFQGKKPFRAWVWHLVHLPQQCSGRTLTLHVRSNAHETTIVGQVTFGDGTLLLDEMVRANMISLLLSICYILIGVFFFAVSFIIRDIHQYRGMITASIGLGTFELFALPIMQQFFYAPQLFYFLDHLGFYVCCVGFLLLMESLIAVPYKPLFKRLWKAMLLYGSVMMAAELTVHPPNLWHTIPIYCIAVVCIAILFWCSMKSLRLPDFDMRIPLLIFDAYTVLVLVEIGVYFYEVEARAGIPENTFLNIGSVLFFTMLGWSIFSQYDKMNRRLIASQQQALKSQQLAHEAAERHQRDRAEYERNIILSREEERLRIARDLHDEVGSRLTEIRLVSELANDETERGSSLKDKLKELSAATEDIVSTFSEIVWSLNPKNDSLEDMAVYVGQRAIDFLAKANIHCRLDLPPEFPALKIDSQARHHLIMAIKETLNNIVKHADASLVMMSIVLENDTLTIMIADDGRGFDASAARKDGNGLANIRKRMENIGGTAFIESVPFQGTKVTLQAHQRDIGTI